LTLSQWAERHAYLSAESSAQPGKWHAYPYQVGMLDAITDPRNDRVTFLKSARVGYTKLVNMAIGYHVHQDPCPMLVVQPTVDDAEGWSKDELAPLLRDTPALRGLVADQKRQDGNNTILKKLFPGGQIVITGANSARGFRRITVRKVFFDEVDGYPPEGAGDEGDQIALGSRRTFTFWNRQIVLGSTPTIKGVSRIEQAWEESDKRRYYVPCPFCGYMQVLKWANLDWSTKGTRQNPVFVCESCADGIDYTHHRWMIEHGEWRAEAEFNGHAGFHIWAAYSYSPNAVWSKLVDEFHEVKADPIRLRTFVNTVLGETWDDPGNQLDASALAAMAKPWDMDNLPGGVVAVTCGVDTQDDRLEVLPCFWGHGQELWLPPKIVLWGDPAKPEVWRQLETELGRTYRRVDGTILRVGAALIDSGGHHTSSVYNFAFGKSARRIFACKGRDGEGQPLASRPFRSGTRKVRLIHVGTHTAKELIYARLTGNIESGPGAIHLHPSIDVEQYRELCSEKCITKHKHGQAPKRVWIKLRVRNETLDMLVYALAALDVWKLKLESLETGDHDASDEDPEDQPEDPAPARTPLNLAAMRRQLAGVSAARTGGSWASRW
jgi:phage terminase large subunit GpA-like protein